MRINRRTIARDAAETGVIKPEQGRQSQPGEPRFAVAENLALTRALAEVPASADAILGIGSLPDCAAANEMIRKVEVDQDHFRPEMKVRLVGVPGAAGARVEVVPGDLMPLPFVPAGEGPAVEAVVVDDEIYGTLTLTTAHAAHFSAAGVVPVSARVVAAVADCACRLLEAFDAASSRKGDDTLGALLALAFHRGRRSAVACEDVRGQIRQLSIQTAGYVEWALGELHRDVQRGLDCGWDGAWGRLDVLCLAVTLSSHVLRTHAAKGDAQRATVSQITAILFAYLLTRLDKHGDKRWDRGCWEAVLWHHLECKEGHLQFTDGSVVSDSFFSTSRGMGIYYPYDPICNALLAYTGGERADCRATLWHTLEEKGGEQALIRECVAAIRSDMRPHVPPQCLVDRVRPLLDPERFPYLHRYVGAAHDWPLDLHKLNTAECALLVRTVATFLRGRLTWMITPVEQVEHALFGEDSRSVRWLAEVVEGCDVALMIEFDPRHVALGAFKSLFPQVQSFHKTTYGGARSWRLPGFRVGVARVSTATQRFLGWVLSNNRDYDAIQQADSSAKILTEISPCHLERILETAETNGLLPVPADLGANPQCVA